MAFVSLFFSLPSLFVLSYDVSATVDSDSVSVNLQFPKCFHESLLTLVFTSVEEAAYVSLKCFHESLLRRSFTGVRVFKYARQAVAETIVDVCPPGCPGARAVPLTLATIGPPLQKSFLSKLQATGAGEERPAVEIHLLASSCVPDCLRSTEGPSPCGVFAWAFTQEVYGGDPRRESKLISSTLKRKKSASKRGKGQKRRRATGQAI